MVGIIGNHQDTGFSAHLLQIVGNTRDLHRSCLRGFQFRAAQREFDATGEHLHGTDFKRRLARIDQQDLSRFLRLAAEVGEINVGGRDL